MVIKPEHQVTDSSVGAQRTSIGPIELDRRIAHLDMDAFYASVELLRYPQLRGLPVVIGGARRAPDDVLFKRFDGRLHEIPIDEFPRLKEYVGRGVITTATYPARAFGIGSAMGLMKASKLCPDAILLPVDFPLYRTYSKRFKEVIRSIAPTMEDRGVDEVYIDFTNVIGGQSQGGYALAALIQDSIFKATGLTCSVGVAPNKLLAKMASEFNKPNGISIVQEDDIQIKVWPLACRKINGVGPRAEEKLKAMGISTIGELARESTASLIAAFGPKTGAWLHRAAMGIDEREVVTDSEPITISRETTFDKNLHAVRDKERLGEIFTALCEQLSDDLNRKGYSGKLVSIKLRDDQFKTYTRSQALNVPTNNAKSIRNAAGRALRRAPLQRPLRLLGVRIDGLTRNDDTRISSSASDSEERQPSLF